MLNKWGIKTHLDAKAQRILDRANGRAKTMSRGQKRVLETASVSQEEEHRPTVVSSTDGANILKNLDILAKRFRESFKSVYTTSEAE